VAPLIGGHQVKLDSELAGSNTRWMPIFMALAGQR
jgi:hypothetical protein